MPFFRACNKKMNKKERSERQFQRALTLLGSVSSLCVMTVMDVLLAFWGGDWLDNYFATGDHSLRLVCILVAIGASLLSFYNVVRVAMMELDEE